MPLQKHNPLKYLKENANQDKFGCMQKSTGIKTKDKCIYNIFLKS